MDFQNFCGMDVCFFWNGRPKSFGMEVQEYGTNKRTKMFEMFEIIQMKTMPKGNTVTTVFFDSKICKKYRL